MMAAKRVNGSAATKAPARLPPNDLEAEAAVLSAVMIDDGAIDKIDFLKPEHFYAEAHRQIYGACVALKSAAKPRDVVTVGSWLKDRERIAQVGGMGYLATILSAAPAVTNVAAYGRIVVDKWQRRETIQALALKSAELELGRVSVDQARDEIARAMTAIAPAPAPEPAPKQLPAADLVRALIGQKPARRLKTGIATLDQIARGGLPEGKLVFVGGPPGGGKTTLVTQAGDVAAREGWCTAFVVADGPTEDVLQRLAQLAGFTRDEFDARDPEALNLFAERLERIRLFVLDADACPFLEDASAMLRAERDDAPSLLIVDSAQTLRCRAAEIADGPRARLDATTEVLKRCARSDGHLVVATSELARGAYRSKNSQEQIEDLAAFKESGSLEYAADVALVLRSVRDEEDLIDVTVPKSRLGAKTPFRLRLDRRHMRLNEIALDPNEQEHRREAAEDARTEHDVRTLERFLVEHPGVNGISALRAGLRAAGVQIGQSRIDVAVARLGDRIVNRAEKGRPRWFLKTEVSP